MPKLSPVATGLLEDVQFAQPIPPRIVEQYRGSWKPWITALIMDGLLELECESGFVSGPDAVPLLFESQPKHEAHGITAELSYRALKMGQFAGETPVKDLQARLYRFNSIPASPRWHRRLPSPDALRDRLEITPGPLAARTRAWKPSSVPGPGWIGWERIERGDANELGRTKFKLYVSPAANAVADVLPTILETLGRTDALVLKLGDSAYGLLRPDKLVAYFSDFRELEKAANALSTTHADVPAQGVPFTASLSEGGLLSWAIDPARGGTGPHDQLESFRSWITKRLACSLVQSRSGSDREVQAWEFALTRLRLEGIDTNTFAPVRLDWPGDAFV
jgi:hypothetical protein